MIKNYLLLILVLFTQTASAHTGFHEVSDFLNGFFHPFSGVDHVLIMVGVGLLARHFKLAIGLTMGLFASFVLLLSFTHGLISSSYDVGFMFAMMILNAIGLSLGSLFIKPQAE